MLNVTPVAGSVYAPGAGFEIWNCRSPLGTGGSRADRPQSKLLPPIGRARV